MDSYESNAHPAILDGFINQVRKIESLHFPVEFISGVNSSGEHVHLKKHNYMDRCPDCGSYLVTDEDFNGLYCPNIMCPAQKLRYFEFFGSRECMDIDGLGPTTIETLNNLGLLNNVVDLYNLHMFDTAVKEALGAKTADKLFAAIEKSKSRDINSLIKALGMPGIGNHIGKELAKRYADMGRIVFLTMDELRAIEGVGETSATVMYKFFHSAEGNNLVSDLARKGVNMTSLNYGATSGTVLAGKTFVITGTLPTMGRDEAKKLIEANGGKTSGSVSKKTTYLLAGEAAGGKLDDAKALGITIISEDELKAMLI